MNIFLVRFIGSIAFGIALLGVIDASALALTGVQSRKVHGAVGALDWPISTAPAIGGLVTVEPRIVGAGHVIVFQFDGPITATGVASAMDAFGPVGSVSATITGATNNEVSITLTGIPENKRISISLSQVNGVLDVGPVSLGFLVGDVDNSRTTSASDVSRIKARSGQTTSASSREYDLNANGFINAADISAVKARSGVALSSVGEVSLLVSKLGMGAGVVSSVPAGINCGNTCAANFTQNTAIALTATSNTGSNFTTWSGACTGTASTSTFVLATSSICNATFAINTYAVTPTLGPDGTISPLTVQTISHGSTATFTIAPNAGFAANVGGTCGGTLVGTTYTTNPITEPCTVEATFATAPLILYTDIVSGPNIGGENNKGIYLSIFGKNFGTAGGNTKVFINNVEVDNYRYFGPSKGRTDIQQITVQIGALGNPVAGTPLPIRVSVNGLDSNTDKTFIVNPGNIYFVNNVSGVDTGDTTTGGTFTAPFKTVQKSAGTNINFAIASAASSGAWGRVRAGDFIVMRGTGTPYAVNQSTGVNVGFNGYFFRALNKSGCAIGTLCPRGGGTTSGPITLMGYPAEDVFINDPYTATGGAGAISSASSARIQEGKGHWINIVNLRVESGNSNGAVNTQAGGSNWRIVNNELTCADAVNNPGAFAGGIAGNASAAALAPGPSQGSFYLGNYIHDVYSREDAGIGMLQSHPLQHHGVYVDGSGTYDIGYNRIENIRGGNGLQTYTDGTNGSPTVDGVSFHHNVIRNVAKHGINIADQTRNGIKIWNNIVYDIDQAGLRFNTTELVDAKIFNNTVYNVNRVNSNNLGAMQNDLNFLSLSAVDIRNNIFVPVTGAYDRGSGFKGTVSNNLWFGGTGSSPASSYSTSSLTANPLFVSVAVGNFRLSAGSPAIDSGTIGVSAVVVNDYEQKQRPVGGGYDIGAFDQ